MVDRERELRDVNEELRRSEAALRKLHAQLATVEEAQRRELAAQLHDTVVQLLSLASMKLQTMRRQATDESQLTSLNELLEIIERAIAESRGLLTQLSPPLLYEVGLVPALRRLAEQLTGIHSLRIDIVAEGELEPLDDAAKGLLFHAVREMLINVIKHAQATEAIVRLERADDEVRVSVRDNGIGLQPQAPRLPGPEGGFGLRNIRERLEPIGGSLTLENAPEGGAVATLRHPLGGWAQ